MKKIIFITCFVCMLASCGIFKKEMPYYPFSREVEVHTIIDFYKWREGQHALEKCYVGLRRLDNKQLDIQDTIEVDGLLAEYINYVAGRSPNNTENFEFWSNPKCVVLGDIYIGNKHFVWNSSNFLNELNPRGVYLFPLHYEVLVSNPELGFFCDIREEDRAEFIKEFNLRWNHVIEYMISVWTHRS